MSQMTIGEFFKKMRKNRGLTLEEAVAGAHYSPAALSRFERNETDLSVEDAVPIIANLQITAPNFKRFMDNNDGQLTTQLYTAFFSRDKAAIAKLAAGFETAHKDDHRPTTDYARFLFRISAVDHDAPIHLNHQQEAAVARFLNPFPGWNIGVHQLTMAAAMRFASQDLLGLITARLDAYQQLFTAESINDSKIPDADYGLLLIHLVARREMALAAQMMAATTRYHGLRIAVHVPGPLNVLAMNGAPFVQFAQAAYRWAKAPNETDAAAAQRVIDQARELMAPALADYLAAMWSFIRVGRSSWRNLKLTASPALTDFSQVEWTFNGATIAAVRKHYQLTLEDVITDRTVSSQSRFEKGATQLGFRAAIGLLQTLLLEPTMFYRNTFLSTYIELDQLLAPASPKTGAARLAEVREAVETACARLPEKPAALRDLNRTTFWIRGAQRLMNEGFSSEESVAAGFDTDVFAEWAMRGVRGLTHVQLSDFIAFSECTNSLPGELSYEGWRILFSHADFDLSTAAVCTDMLENVVLNLALDGHVDLILQLQHALDNLWQDKVWIASSMTVAVSTCLFQMYADPARADDLWALNKRQQEAMAGFAERNDKGSVWIGNTFEVTERYVKPAFDEWRATH
ncbi:helix-turn-helix domain-containing protein [Lacticaseibacillus mingshuiensis]|uniref:Helix-turn-helix domain-containing protein n=1 Tax=Lacticaseibacillus mingshuiensis TaxID=2799574 RepID=A0ABW4CHB8_9LACO|nr:helix-turn-helix transcriptional regulator [Lacticaseibacillus mingshuiensis]